MRWWPYLGEGRQKDAGLALPSRPRDQDSEDRGLEGISGICNDFIEELHKHCQEYFFPSEYSKVDINQAITTFYGLPGVFYTSEDVLTVSLEIGPDSPYRKGLEYAVRRVNEQNIFDYSGRRLWLEM